MWRAEWKHRFSEGVTFMKQHRRTVSLFAVTTILSVVFIVVWLNQGRAQNSLLGLRSSIETLNEILIKANDNFYKDADQQKMLEGAIRGAVGALNDPYSFYQSADEQKREREDLFQAKFGGLGIRIYADVEGEGGIVKISTPLRNSPAVKAGLQAGDAIIKVNGESVLLGGATGLSLNDVVSKLRGPVGEPVTITVLRRGRGQFDVAVTREEIKPESVHFDTVEPGIAYIAIDQFTGSTMDEFAKALASAEKQPLKAVILDLRGNRGGLLTAAWQVSDAFLDKGVIVSTKGKRKEFNHEYRADSQLQVPNDVEVIVLVDEHSASGSEIVAGALKDLKRGILIGTKTFGKGVVQQRFDLKNGGAVSLTISSYYTPNGTSIDGQGIEPNVAKAPTRLTDEEALIREKIREKKLVEIWVLEYIENYEKTHGKTPKEFTELEPKLTELQTSLEEKSLHLNPRWVRLEARGVFDLNVGNERLYDLENDVQLAEAIHIIKQVGVARVLDGTYQPTAQTVPSKVTN